MRDRIMLAVMSILLIPTVSFAASQMPDAGSERIKWVAECCGKMPTAMTVGLVVLGILIVMTVSEAKKKDNKGSGKK